MGRGHVRQHKKKLVVQAKALKQAHSKQQKRKAAVAQRTKTELIRKQKKKLLNAKSPYTPYATPPRAHAPVTAGKGNFSFGAALAVLFGGRAQNIVATCYDSEKTLTAKYSDGAANIAVLLQSGATVLYEVDATRLHQHPYFASGAGASATGGVSAASAFDVIIFNFPHSGAGIKDQALNIRANQSVLFGFFQSVILSGVLKYPAGAVHVTLKKGQPYAQWNVTKLALDATKPIGTAAAAAAAGSSGNAKGGGSQPGGTGARQAWKAVAAKPLAATAAADAVYLKCRAAIEFYPHLYPGYVHRRTIGFKVNHSNFGDDDSDGDYNGDPTASAAAAAAASGAGGDDLMFSGGSGLSVVRDTSAIEHDSDSDGDLKTGNPNRNAPSDDDDDDADAAPARKKVKIDTKRSAAAAAGGDDSDSEDLLADSDFDSDDATTAASGTAAGGDEKGAVIQHTAATKQLLAEQFARAEKMLIASVNAATSKKAHSAPGVLNPGKIAAKQLTIRDGNEDIAIGAVTYVFQRNLPNLPSAFGSTTSIRGKKRAKQIEKELKKASGGGADDDDDDDNGGGAAANADSTNGGGDSKSNAHPSASPALGSRNSAFLSAAAAAGSGVRPRHSPSPSASPLTGASLTAALSFPPLVLPSPVLGAALTPGSSGAIKKSPKLGPSAAALMLPPAALTATTAVTTSKAAKTITVGGGGKPPLHIKPKSKKPAAAAAATAASPIAAAAPAPAPKRNGGGAAAAALSEFSLDLDSPQKPARGAAGGGGTHNQKHAVKAKKTHAAAAAAATAKPASKPAAAAKPAAKAGSTPRK